jgi:hypothetical protein
MVRSRLFALVAGTFLASAVGFAAVSGQGTSKAAPQLMTVYKSPT